MTHSRCLKTIHWLHIYEKIDGLLLYFWKKNTKNTRNFVINSALPRQRNHKTVMENCSSFLKTIRSRNQGQLKSCWKIKLKKRIKNMTESRFCLVINFKKGPLMIQAFLETSGTLKITTSKWALHCILMPAELYFFISFWKLKIIRKMCENILIQCPGEIRRQREGNKKTPSYFRKLVPTWTTQEKPFEAKPC